MGAICSDPAQNAASAAQATSTADNAEIGQEENYVNTAEGQLRGAISGLGPNPYFQPPAKPAPVNPANTTSFTTPAPQAQPQTQPTAPQPQAIPRTTQGNPFAPPQQNPFVQQRQAQPAARAPARAQ